MVNLDGYTVKEKLSSDLLGVTSPLYGNQMWRRCRVTYRKRGEACCICGMSIEQVAFRPMTNLGNRGRRMCERHVPA